MFLHGTLEGKPISIPFLKLNKFFEMHPEVTLYGKPIKDNPYGEDNHPLKTIMYD